MPKLISKIRKKIDWESLMNYHELLVPDIAKKLNVSDSYAYILKNKESVSLNVYRSIKEAFPDIDNFLKKED